MSNTTETTISAFEQILLNIDTDQALQRTDCLNIYRYWWFGKRIVNSIIRFAFSSKRIIDSDDIPQVAKDEFMKISKLKQQDYYIKRACANARIYGMSVLAVLHKEKELKENLTVSDMKKDLWHFCSYDPMTTAGTTVNQSPWAYDFLKAKKIKIGGKTLAPNRGTLLLNGDQQYLSYTESTYTFGGVSVFYNMIPLIRGTVSGIISLRRMAAKASAIVHKGGDGGKLNGIVMTAAQHTLELIKSLTNTGAMHIGKSDSVEFFPMTGANEVDAVLKEMNNQILIALDDTPASILLDRAMSNNFSEGTSDYKATVIAVESFRESMVTPLYEFTDPFIMNTAWNDDFIKAYIQANPEEYQGYGISTIRKIWIDSFSYKYGSLFPKDEKETEEINGIILDNLIRAKELGATDEADLKEEIKARKIFQTEFDFYDVDNEDENDAEDLL